MQIASYIDHTILRPTSTHIEIKKICEEALLGQICGRLVIPLGGRAGPERALLTGSPVRTATVIGFPFGYSVIAAAVGGGGAGHFDGAR